MASATNKEKSSSQDHTRDIDKNSFLAEEQRLFHSKDHSSKTPVTNQVSEKRISKLCQRINQMNSERVDVELEKYQLSTSGDLDIRRIRLKHHSISELKYGCDNSSRKIEQQPFEYIAVVDFEATCEESQRNKYKHEIIEFPIVLINVQEQKIVDQFRSYCRPKLNPTLSKFCTDLTGIKQDQVDNAPSFVEVLHMVETWLNERNLFSSKLAFATDGPWDFENFLQLQCQISSIPFPEWARKWINIRKEFSSFYSSRRCGIEKMLEKLGLDFDGHRHSGLDDSINIARIAIELLKDGCILTLNDGLRENDSKSDKSNAENKDDEESSVVFTN